MDPTGDRTTTPTSSRLTPMEAFEADQPAFDRTFPFFFVSHSKNKHEHIARPQEELPHSDRFDPS